MRIPFDLIAAILCIDRLGAMMYHSGTDPRGVIETVAVWLGFLLLSWLSHDLAARQTEQRTSFGNKPDGGGRGLHPHQFYSRCVIVAQIVSVLIFAAAVSYLNWPAMVSRWPAWFGLDPNVSLGRLQLGRSLFAGTFLAISPYMAAMVLSWIPRWRLATGSRHRAIPLLPYLSFEAKISWLPLSLCALVALISDLTHFLPVSFTALFDSELAQFFLLIGAVLFGATILVPVAAVKLWKCEKMPDGELKQRLEKIMARSGVKARAVLLWGGRGTGILNACVLGPWSRFRYVLISPLLADELTLDEAEAVLGHELGHARYGHLTFYFVILLAMSALIAAFSLVPAWVSVYQTPSAPWKIWPMLEAGLTLTFMIGYIYFIFGALSRRCEREADLASAELLGTPQPLVTALEKIAWMNGNMRQVPCWHHGSIAERIDAVQQLSANPEATRQFHQRQRFLRITLTAMTATLIAALIFQYARM